jgi:hypothetical protein
MMAPELDAAINYADHKVKELYDQKQKRRHARALIAKLLEGMEAEVQGGHSDEQLHFDCGYIAAITEIRRRAGIEGGES